MWLATLFIAFIATAKKKKKGHQKLKDGTPEGKSFRRGLALRLTVQVIVFLAVRVREGVQFPQQEGILENPLDGLDQVRLQSVGVLLLGVALVQEGFEGCIVLG